MIDRYPSLSVTHTARGLSPPVCTFIEEHRNTYTQAHTCTHRSDIMGNYC